MNRPFAAALLALLAITFAARAEPPTSFKFTFGRAKPGADLLTPASVYARAVGYGFDLGSQVTADERGGCVTAARPFFFSVDLPEGNYDVTVTFGDAQAEAITTVKAESRRLMLQQFRTAAGQFETRTFTVNVRTPRIAGGGQVKLKARELNYLHWDEKLTLEFNGQHPALRALEIKPAPDAITVYLAGDSTVTDQPNEPWNSWGQMLPRFFKPGVAVANHAESGESLGSFLGAHRLDKILSTLKPGDYLFIQFGHNDQKDKAPGSGAFTTYKERLVHFVTEARKRNAVPVLLTPMHRRRFDAAGKVVNSLGDFPDAVRQAAKETGAPLIDLNAMSARLYEAWGADGSKAGFQDGTHHNNYGSYELARCVVEGIKQVDPKLAKLLADDAGSFDPSHPDAVDKFDVPASPRNAATATTPEGS